MTSELKIQKPIVEQIYDELFLLLGDRGFDSEAIEKLRQIAENGELKISKKVTNAIKVLPEDRE